MKNFLIEVEPVSDNGITGHITTLGGGLRLTDGRCLLRTSMAIEQLRALLTQSCPNRLVVIELAEQQELEALKLKWLGEEGATTALLLEDFAEPTKAREWSLRA
jgi:hypothetical protein